MKANFPRTDARRRESQKQGMPAARARKSASASSSAIATRAERLPALSFQTKEDQVADFLRERIISGFFQRGQKLKQMEIAEMLDLSITPVREALKLLEAEGFIYGSSHRGSVVAPLQLDRLVELYDLRYDLETRLARAAAVRVTPASLKSLVDINDAMLAALRQSDLAVIRSANFRFHFRFYELAELPQTLHFVRILWAKYPFELLAVMPNRPQDVIDEHQAFLDALVSGDAPGAVRCMQAHIAHGHSKFRKLYATRLPTAR
jgi:DNA-binding GntR family transcriptional regulator